MVKHQHIICNLLLDIFLVLFFFNGRISCDYTNEQYEQDYGLGQYGGDYEKPHQYEERAYGKPGKGGLIDVDVHKTDYGGKHVGVHVPIFYKMDLDKDPYRKGLGINVLEGLVKVRVKKDPYADKNNVLVALAGLPIWNSR